MRHEYVNLSWPMAAKDRSARGRLRKFLLPNREGKSKLLPWTLFCLNLAVGSAAAVSGSQGWLCE